MPYINVPIADLRAAPKEARADFSHDDIRLSQLLYGEEIVIVGREGNYLKILASEQENYPGWVHCNEVEEAPRAEPTHVISALMAPLGNLTLSYGTYLTEEESSRIEPTLIRPIPKEVDPALLAKEAQLFLSAPYLWGGRSAPLPGKTASVDCSGLINLLYRAQGKQIPRDAHEQCCAAKHSPPIAGLPLYLKKGNRFSHVVVYLSEDLCLESPETGKPVCITPLTWKRHMVTIGERAPGYWSVKTF